MITVDVGRIARNLDHMLPAAARPVRGGERAALSHTLKGQAFFMRSVAEAVTSSGKAELAPAAERFTAAAAQLDAARSAVVGAEKVGWRWPNRFDASAAVPHLEQARDDVRAGAELIGDTPLPLKVSGREVSSIDELVPPELVRPEDAKYLDNTGGKVQGAIRGLSKLGLRRGLGIKVHGAENIPKEGGFLLVGNHAYGALDAVFVTQGHQRNVRLMAAGHFENSGWQSAVWKAGGAFPIDKGEPQRGMSIAKQAAEQRGQGIAIFPEQRTMRSDWPAEPRDGVSWLASGTDVPTVAVGVYGNKPAYTRGESFFRRPMVEISFERVEGIERGTATAEGLAANRERIWQAVDAQHEAARGRYAQRRAGEHRGAGWALAGVAALGGTGAVLYARDELPFVSRR